MNMKKYFADMGAKGGKKSKRKLTKKDARKMATKRWKESKAEVADAVATVPPRARGSRNTTAQESNG